MELFLTVDLWEVALARDRLGCQPDNTGGTFGTLRPLEAASHNRQLAWWFCLNREAQNVPVNIKSTLDDE
ncbi:hypothetical protein BDK62_11664 [Halomonas alkaliantarctica]|jgi:hypothetical protein